MHHLRKMRKQQCHKHLMQARGPWFANSPTYLNNNCNRFVNN